MMLADCGGCASSGMVLPMIGMVRTGCSRWWATRGSSAFAAAPAGALFLAGDCAMKAVIATAQQMAATTTANRVSRWMLNGSRSSVIAWELGQLEWEVSVPMAGSLFLSGTCHIGSDGWDILRARLWQFCVTSAARADRRAFAGTDGWGPE